MEGLRWNATRRGWMGETEEAVIFVSEQTYQRCLSDYLAGQGVEYKTWRQIMQPAEDAWHRQMEAERTFQQDLAYWLTCREAGVSISWRTSYEQEQGEEIKRLP